jgi:uncharacterized protein YbjT (DUF2867 family)
MRSRRHASRVQAIKQEVAMYAVIGASGKVGGAVANTLLAAGQNVRVVVRNAQNGKVWAERGCEIALAEIEDVAAMAAAFEGVEGGFVMLPPTFDPSAGFVEARAMIAALHAALVKAAPAKLVVLSTIGAAAPQSNLLNQLGLLEKALADLPMPVTYLRAAWFMENAALDIADAKNTGVIASYLQPLDKMFPMIATDDVGRVAAELLLEAWQGHRVVELEGLARKSPNDLAAAFAAALEQPVAARVVPRDSWDTIFRAQGMKNPEPRIQMLDGFNEGWIEFADKGAAARRGKITLEQAVAKLLGTTKALR